MKTITLELPDQMINEFIDTYGYGYRDKDPDGKPVTETKEQYAAKLFRDEVIKRIADHKRREAAKALQFEGKGININIK